MAKRKKKNSRIIQVIFTVLIAIMVLIWALVACKEIILKPDNQDSTSLQETSTDTNLSEVDNTSESQDVNGNQDQNQDQSQEQSQDQGTANSDSTSDSNEQPNNQSDSDTPQGGDIQDDFDDTIDPSTLASDSVEWSFKRNTDHTPPIGYNQGIDLAKYGAYYKVDTQEKVIYLTFDEGYENGYTASILDTLKANDVKAAFFVTKPYIDSSPDLCIRMKEEGHVVGNHSVTHRKFSTLSDDEIEQELQGTQDEFEKLTGYEMDHFFRPPSGDFSERVLYDVRKQGYRTFFWSLAYADWDVNNQPGKEYTYNHVMENYHPGGIFLLHAVSQSNAEALDSVIKSLKEKGYRFGSLYEIE